MKDGTSKSKPDNRIWNVLAAFLLLFVFSGLRMMLTEHQDSFHYTFNILTVLFVSTSAIGVFAYSNNRALFFRAFWVIYFYFHGIFMAFYNIHCLQQHAVPSFAESLVGIFVNAGIVALLPLYVLYRYAFIKDSF